METPYLNPKITTWLNYFPEDNIGEVNTLPSETQPDEVLSVKEMLFNHVRGLPQNYGSGGEGVYYPEEYGYIPHPDELDLVEKRDMSQYFAKLADELQNPKQPESGEADKPPMSDGLNEPDSE